METEQIKSIFKKGVRKYSWGIPFAHVFFLTLGLLLMITAYFIVSIGNGTSWVFAVILALVGGRMIIVQMLSIIHREWLDPCRYMLRFLEGKHNSLVWAYYTAGQDSNRSKAGEAAPDGLCYTLCFWFANKTCCRVTGKKPVLDQILTYFNRHYADISSGYSRELEHRFFHDPLSLKTRPVHSFSVCAGASPLVFRSQRFKGRFAKQMGALGTAVGSILKVLWFCISFSVSLYFLSTFAWNLYMSLSCANWPTTTGVVQYIGGSGEDSFISYTYDIDRKTFYGNRLTFAGDPGAHLDNYSINNTVTVHYEPTFPAQSVLILGGFDPYNYAYLGLGILFIGIGWIAYGWGIGKYKTITDPVYWI